MSRWHDWIDWIGGYPYERASLEQIAEIYAKDGFRLTKIFDCSQGYGCNEFVFRREARSGHYIEVKLPGGRSMARRFGHRVAGPFELTPDGWAGRLLGTVELRPDATAFLIKNETLVGPVALLPNDCAIVASANEVEGHINDQAYYIVVAH